MRIDRLELETPSETVELTLHPLLTVVTGLGRLEREALTSEILGAIGLGRPGLSADVLGPDNKFLQVCRPLQGTPTVVDAISGDDLTDRYRSGEGIDVLSSLGLDRGQARTLLRMGRRDVRAPVGKWEVIERLARLDQEQLWKTATRVLENEVAISEVAEQTSARRGTIEELENQHADLEAAADRLDRIESDVVATALASIMVAFLAGILFGPMLALPCVAVAVGAGAVYGHHHRRLARAIEAERKLLAEAGIATYLDYQMTRVENLTEGEDRRHQLEFMEMRRIAAADWNELTGGVALAWAIDHRPEITQLHLTVDLPEASNPHLLDVLPRLDDARLGAIDALEQRVGQLSVLFPTGMTLLLDDPFCDLDDFELTAAISTLEDAMSSHQMVLMSDDPRILGWARELAVQSRATVLHLGGQAQPVEPEVVQPLPAPELVDA